MAESIAAWLVSAGVSASYATAVAYAIVITATVAYGNYQRRAAERRSKSLYNKSLEDKTYMLQSAVSTAASLYGTVPISGPIVFAHSSGDKKQFLHLVISLGAREIDGFEAIYFNNEELPLPSGDGFVYSSFTQSSKLVETHDFITLSGGATSFDLGVVPTEIHGVWIANGSNEDTGTTPVSYSHTAGSSVITGLPPNSEVHVDYSYTQLSPSRFMSSLRSR